MIRQSPRLSTKSDKSAGSAMRSGSQPSNFKITIADAVVAVPTPEEKKARERVELRKRRNKKQGPEEGKAGKQDEFVLRPTYDVVGRELISLMAATLREIGKQDIMESPTKADETNQTMLLAGPWPRRWARFSFAVQASKSEQSLWMDWVIPMAST